MNDLLTKQILIIQLKSPQKIQLNVDGTSMLPTLHPGDSIEICSKDDYTIGDILVFFYKNDTVLVHRLLKIENRRYFCKGDNSFRLEDIEKKTSLVQSTLNPMKIIVRVLSKLHIQSAKYSAKMVIMSIKQRNHSNTLIMLKNI